MNKQISQGVVLSFLAQEIAIVVNLVYNPFVIRILGQSEYGLYQLVQSVVNYLNLMNFGFTFAYISFYSRAKAQEGEEGVARINGMFLRIFLVITAICVAAGAFLVSHIQLLGSRLSAADYVTARKIMILLVLNLACSFPTSVFTVYITARERFVFKRGLVILNYVLIPLCGLPVLYLGGGAVGLAWVTLGLSVLKLVLNMWYCLGPLGMRFRFGKFDRALFAELVAFTFFVFLSDVVDQMNSNVDKLLLARLMGTVPVAVYSVGFELCTYFIFCSWVIPEMFVPEVNRVAVEERDDGKLTEIFIRIGRYNNYVLLLILTGFILVGRPFIQLWAGEGYEQSYWVGVILMLANYIQGVQSIGVNIQTAKNQHRPRAIIYFIIACVNVAASIALIRLWGVVGTSLGTLAAMVLGTGLFMNLYYHFRVGLNVIAFWKALLRWIPQALLLCLGGWLLVRNLTLNSWPRLLGVVAAYAVVYALMLWGTGMDKNEKATIRQALARK
ncbi:MAG: oligosaccharide flippase family protein [Clostridia bacterium]|nr:oligosaccharide flippase family protein [Clostridia bacterium]